MLPPIQRALAATAALAATGGFAASASASTALVTSDTGYLSVHGSPGEVNKVVIQDAGPNRFVVTDHSATLNAGAGCVRRDLHTADCAGGTRDVRRFAVYLGDQDDLVSQQSTYLVAGASVLAGDAGNDTIYDLATAANGHFGGAGFDTIVYHRPAGVIVTLDSQTNDGQGGAEGDNVSSDIERIHGGDGNDFLIGNAAGNQLFGGNGNDDIHGAGGNDVLEGNAGVDKLFGGPGDDTVNSNDGVRDEVVECNDGIDTDVIDLLDPISPRCERVFRSPVKTGRPVEIRNSSARVGANAVPVRLRCHNDRQGGVCKGTLRLERNGHMIGSARYSLRKRRQRTVRVPLRSPVSGRVRVTATANEKAADGRSMTMSAPLMLLG